MNFPGHVLQGQAAGTRDGLGRTIAAVLVPQSRQQQSPGCPAGQLLPGGTAVPATRCPSPRSRCLEQQQDFRSCKLKDNSLLLNLIFISDDCLHLCCQAEGHTQPLCNLVLAQGNRSYLDAFGTFPNPCQLVPAVLFGMFQPLSALLSGTPV